MFFFSVLTVLARTEGGVLNLVIDDHGHNIVSDPNVVTVFCFENLGKEIYWLNAEKNVKCSGHIEIVLD